MTYRYGSVDDELLFSSLNLAAKLLSGADESDYEVYDQQCCELIDRYDNEGLVRLCESGKLLARVVVPLLSDADGEWYIQRVLHNSNKAIAGVAAGWPHRNPRVHTQILLDRFVKPVNIVRFN